MKKRSLKLLLSCLAVAISLPMLAQTELTNIINYGLNHSRDIRKASWQQQEAKYIRKEAISKGLPQIEGSAGYSKMMLPGGLDLPESIYQMVPEKYAGLLDQISGLDQLNSTSAGIQVTQLIYSQAYIVGLQTSKKTEELYKALKTKKEEEVIAEIAHTYYQIGSMMLQQETIKKSTQNLSDIYKMTDLKYKSDLIKETDLNRLKVSITNLEVTQITLENAINIQLNYMKALTGMPLDTTLSITPTLEVDFANELNSFAPEKVPAYRVLLKQNEIYGLQIKQAKAKYYPSLAAYGKFDFSAYSTENNFDSWTNMNTLGVKMTIPIFYSGTDYAKVKQAKFKQAQLNEDIQQTKDLLLIKYNNAQSEYLTAQKLLAVQKENRKLAERVYKQTKMQFEEGMASMADLLNVNSDFLQADNSYNQQIIKCKTAEIKMLDASGNLKSLIKN